MARKKKETPYGITPVVGLPPDLASRVDDYIQGPRPVSISIVMKSGHTHTLSHMDNYEGDQIWDCGTAHIKIEDGHLVTVSDIRDTTDLNKVYVPLSALRMHIVQAQKDGFKKLPLGYLLEEIHRIYKEDQDE